jgi:glycosyltransferase involved in cell wall biosynthesis
MKIAIVAPSPVPFTVGGAENLFWGLQNYINEHTPHQCELIKIASPESDLEQLINSYAQFSELELDHFDCVISTKYPAWMVRHRNHVCYLLHRLRGLYDTYHFTGLPEQVQWDHPDLRGAAVLAKQIEHIGNRDMDAVFRACKEFIASNRNSKALQFPGPFSRWLIHHLDSLGMAYGAVSRFAAISQVVKQRRDYFPHNAPVSVLHPPPRITGFHCGRDDYLFTVSRLDGPKRIAMLVEAMRHVKADIPLLIAGTGPDEGYIKTLAAADPRIKFLGFVNDHELIDYYANSLAVPFVPYDEDYGLITIEAMMSAKPVLTLTDAGGPNEFVRNGETGFSVSPEPKAIAEQIDYFCSNRDAAREMGKKACGAVSNITWERVVNGLLGESGGGALHVLPKRQAHRKKMVVAVTFPIYPPRGGGQARIYHLYRYLAEHFDIEILSLCAHGLPELNQEIAPGLKEIRVPVSEAHQFAEKQISESVGGLPITDIVADQLIDLTPEYLQKLQIAVANADVVTACHPYLGKRLSVMAPRAEFWLEAQDVEYLLKRDILPDSEAGRCMLESVKEAEAFCWQHASTVFTCAQQDIDTLIDLYGANSAKTMEVANGVSIEDVPFVGDRERQSRKAKIGLDNSLVALFMGSWHGPNIEAADHILKYATTMPAIIFIILGSVCGAIADREIPANVKLLGVVDDNVKAVLLGTADVALNPMTSGSGSNLKMLDYFAAGIPVISTGFGARGISVIAGEHYLLADVLEFPERISEFSTVNFKEIALKARKLAEMDYSWPAIVNKFVKCAKIV